jgi:DNA mismatch endonuclease (patch repair protein)
MGDIVDPETRSRMMSGIRNKNTKPELIIRRGLHHRGYRYCPLFQWPSTRQDFWRQKITRTREKDLESREALEQGGWRVLTIWECAMRGRTRLPDDKIMDMAAEWLDNGTSNLELRGGHSGTD